MTTLRGLPAVHTLLADPRLAMAVARHGHTVVVEAARARLDDMRAALRANPPAVNGPASTPADIAAMVVDAVVATLADWLEPRPRRVVNATGVILHTNLGRAPLSVAAAEAMRSAAEGYTDLEYRLADGRRGSRHDAVAPLLCHLTGADAALVVNNNAGATLLMLSALARGRGVVVSRGQLVEIGGGYRIPDVMAAGGATLVEVGTTNRTRIDDYRAAIDDLTALLLRVHASNYRIVGFTEEASLDALVALGRSAGVPVVDDLGSGSLVDTTAFGLVAEPMVRDSVARGAALVCFSGDKLLGGPQAGIIVGDRDLVARLRRHPLTRAMRPDKATLAGLHATLVHYAEGRALTEVPLWRMIAMPLAETAARAAAWRAALAARGVAADILPDHSTVGGGALPGETLATMLVALRPADCDAFTAALRRADPAVVARIAEHRVVLDPRTVAPHEDAGLVAAVAAAWADQPPSASPSDAGVTASAAPAAPTSPAASSSPATGSRSVR